MGEFETESIDPESLLGMFVDEMKAGSAMLPLSEAFLEHVKKEGLDDDPNTSMTFFYLFMETSAGGNHTFLLTMLEVVYLHGLMTTFINNTVEAFKHDQEG